MATHGEGEPTSNAQMFHTWMTKAFKNGDKNLVKGDIIVFGLGDTQYEKYNRCARDTQKWLIELGGTEAYKYGESDHNYGQADIEKDFFEPWKQDIWTELFKRY